MAGATPTRPVGAPTGPPIASGPRGRSKGSKKTAEAGAAIGELGGEVCPHGLLEKGRVMRRPFTRRRGRPTRGRDARAGHFAPGTTPGRGNLTWGCFRDP